MLTLVSLHRMMDQRGRAMFARSYTPGLLPNLSQSLRRTCMLIKQFTFPMLAPPHPACLASCALEDWRPGCLSFLSIHGRALIFSETLPEPKNRVIYDLFGDSKYKHVLHRMTPVHTCTGRMTGGSRLAVSKTIIPR